MKRAAQGTSLEKDVKRSSASGSRSMQTSSPEAPIRSATRRAWPPAPKVQSIAVWPGDGSSTSISSPASTGTWLAVMSRSSVTGSRPGKASRQLRHRFLEARLLLVPAGAVPYLDRVEVPDQHHLARELRPLDQRLRQHDPAGRVELRVERAGGVVAAKAAVGLVPGIAQAPHLLREALPPVRGPDRHAGLLLLRENDSIRELSPELCRDR